MYNGRYAKKPVSRRRRISKRTGTVMLSLLLLLTFTIGGTLAYLATDTKPLENIFSPSEVTCTVDDKVDENNVKTNIVVTNTGDVNAFIRVKLLSYRVNVHGQIIGGTASVNYTPPQNSGWVKHTDGLYYYTSPVKPEESPLTPLASGVDGDSIQLEEFDMKFDENGDKLSGDLEGGRQVIEVVAEAVQSDGVIVQNGKPVPAVTDAWGIPVKDGKLDLS